MRARWPTVPRNVASAARTAALCSYRVPSRPRRGRGGKSPSGARAGMRARSLSGHGRPVSEPLERPREVAGQEPGDRGREGVFSLVTFSCTSTAPQERRERRSRPEGRRAGCPESQKVTPSQGCEGSSQGRESGFAKRRQSKNKSRWIPASAGMTKWERQPTPSPPNPPLEGEG